MRILVSLMVSVMLGFTSFSSIVMAQPAASAQSPADTRPVKVVASVRPIALLLEELTYGLPVQVQTLLPAGSTPHDYSLKPSDLKAIASADLMVWLGTSVEPYLGKVMQRASQQLAWDQVPGIQRLPMRGKLMELDHGEADHDHGQEQAHEAGHDHGSNDPHFWISVDNAALLLSALQLQLLQLRPEFEPVLAANKRALFQRLQQQISQARQVLAGPSHPFMLAHDAYQYLERDLGLQADVAISLDPEIKPGLKHLMAIKQHIVEHKIGCVIIDPGVSAALLDKVDSKPPLRRVAIDPLAWDFKATDPTSGYSAWLGAMYAKVSTCVQLDKP